MKPGTPRVSVRPRLALVSCCLITFFMGSLHAWSVLVLSIEQTIGMSRASASLVYSGALVCLTISVLFGSYVYTRLSPVAITGLSMVLAAIGLWVAGAASSVMLFTGYSIAFGAANGLAYGFALQLSARVRPSREGFAMGVTTACYGLGAVVGAQVLAGLSDSFGAWTTLRMLARAFLFAAPFLCLLVYFSGARYRTDRTDPKDKTTSLPAGRIAHYWCAYGLACAAGLMAIAHAEPFLAGLQNSSRRFAVAGVVAMGLGNVVAGIVAGIAADRVSSARLIIGLPLISACGLITAATHDAVAVGIAAIVVIGFCYGAMIAVYPSIVAREFGAQHSAAAYGRIFTSWGLAGLVAPTVAGRLFDITGSYQWPMMLAVGLSATSALFAWRLKLLNLN